MSARATSVIDVTVFTNLSTHSSDQTETWVLSEDGNKVADELEYQPESAGFSTSSVDLFRVELAGDY